MMNKEEVVSVSTVANICGDTPQHRRSCKLLIKSDQSRILHSVARLFPTIFFFLFSANSTSEMESVWMSVPFKFVCSVAGPIAHDVQRVTQSVTRARAYTCIPSTTTGNVIERVSASVWAMRLYASADVNVWWFSYGRTTHHSIRTRGGDGSVFGRSTSSSSSFPRYRMSRRIQCCISSSLTHAHEQCLLPSASLLRRHRRRWTHWIHGFMSFVCWCAMFLGDLAYCMKEWTLWNRNEWTGWPIHFYSVFSSINLSIAYHHCRRPLLL